MLKNVKNGEKDKESIYITITKANLEISMKKIIVQLVSNYLTKLSNEYNIFYDGIKEKIAILRILNCYNEDEKSEKINAFRLNEKNRKN